jgi:hypothetical protein
VDGAIITRQRNFSSSNGLYGALASRYMVGFESVSEVVIWAELAPFLYLEPNEGLSALAEYVVYKEMPLDANRKWLSEQIKKGLLLLDDEKRKTLEIVADVNQFVWKELV